MAHPQPTSWHQVSVGTGLLDLACIFSEDKGLRVDCRDRVWLTWACGSHHDAVRLTLETAPTR